jgi:hypothetical protein
MVSNPFSPESEELNCANDDADAIPVHPT